VDAFSYFLDLSMSISGSDADRDALVEARQAMAELNEDCRTPSSVWPAAYRACGWTPYDEQRLRRAG
jgi:hypothetical protein